MALAATYLFSEERGTRGAGDLVHHTKVCSYELSNHVGGMCTSYSVAPCRAGPRSGQFTPFCPASQGGSLIHLCCAIANSISSWPINQCLWLIGQDWFQHDQSIMAYNLLVGTWPNNLRWWLIGQDWFQHDQSIIAYNWLVWTWPINHSLWLIGQVQNDYGPVCTAGQSEADQGLGNTPFVRYP